MVAPVRNILDVPSYLCNSLARLYINHYVKRMLDVQYCCTVFCFGWMSCKVFLTRRRSVTENHFLNRVSVRENMLSDADGACVVIALALCCQNEKNRPWAKQRYNRKFKYTQGNTVGYDRTNVIGFSISFVIYDIRVYLTAIGLTPGGSSTVHIYTQTVHRMQRREHT
jgi:hypothetical protein